MDTKKQKPSGSKEKSSEKSSRTKDRFSSLQSAVTHLSTPGSKYQFDALVAIRKKFIRDNAGVSAFRQSGGISKLLGLLDNHVIANTMKDVALSILGNCCMDGKCRKEVLWKDGIPTICEILTTSDVESIQNRACRTLGNLSLDAECCGIIHQQDDLLLNIVELFLKATESDTKLTFARTIRLLGDTAQHQKAIVASEGIKPLGDLLKLEEESIITAGMKGITEFTKTINSNIARQLISSEVPASLFKLTSHSSSTIAIAADHLIMNYTKSEELRPAIGGAGGIQYFIEGISNADLSNSKRLSMANALCLCCHDSVNRFRIRSQQGLDLLIQVLSEKKFHLIHNRVISSLVCFLYDDASLEILLDNGLIKQLVTHLRRVAKLGPELKEAEEFLKHRRVHETNLSFEPEQDEHDPDDTGSGSSTNSLPQEASTTASYEDDENVLSNDPISVTEVASYESEIAAREQTDSQGVNMEEEKPLLLPIVSESKEPHQNITQTEDSDPEDLALTKGSLPHPNQPEREVTEASEECIIAVTSSTCTLKESQSDPVLSHSSKPIKYSIDSPTYKEVAEWKFEEQYSGPTNIHESTHYWANSPEMTVPSLSPPRTSPYSPLSTGSADWSPEHSPIHSPTEKDSLQSFSPLCSPDRSPLHLADSSDSPPTYSPLMQALPANWSPTQAHNSPVHCPSEGSPLRDQGSWWCEPVLNEANLQYSSDEESSNVKTGDKGSETDANTTDISGPTTSSVTAAAPTSEAPGAPLESLHVFAEVTSIESKAVEIKRKLVGRRESNKKKRSTESPVTKLKILKAVETSSSSSIDLDKMMSWMPETPESSSDYKTEKLQFAKDPRKVTEHNILIILSRMSYLDNPVKYLITIPVWLCLLDYITKASKPLPRAERILMRLVKNPLCFEAITEMMIPFNIAYELSDLRNYSGETKGEKHKKGSREEIKDSRTSRKVSFTIGGETPDISSEDGSVSQSSSGSKQSSHLDNITRQKDLLLNCLTLVTESQYGQGVLAHILMKKSVKHRQQCAISLAYICRSKEQRKKMYISLDGLKWLFDAATSSDIVIQTKALLSLLELARELKDVSLKKDIKDDSRRHHRESLSHILSYDAQRINDVSFRLHDGKIVHGHRVTLAAGSEVFAAMLRGHYSESNLHIIDISDASKSSFQILVNFLHMSGVQLNSRDESDERDTAQPKRKRMATESFNVIDPVDSTEFCGPAKTSKMQTHVTEKSREKSGDNGPPLDTLIELLGLADRYMLESLQHLVADHITANCLNMTNVLQTCQYALLYNCRRLAENCLSFIFFGDLPMWQRMASVTQVFKPDNSTILDLLKDLILRHISH